jgi:hypothetical protein
MKPMTGAAPEGASLPSGTPQITLISVAAFARVCNQPGTELYLMSYKEAEGGRVELANQEVDTDLTLIPPEYYEFADLFSKKEADKLPPHHEYDHTIPLEPGKTLPFGPIYKCSPMELEVTREYIENNLKKRFI